MESEHPDPGKWWQNRRRMAYIALTGLLLIAVVATLGLVPETTVPLAQSIVWALTGIVAVYSGGACVVDAMAELRK